MTFSEKVSPKEQKNQDKPKMQRKCSWKLASRPSLRRKKNRSGSDSEAVPLNNGRDHSQCNGGGVSRQVCTDLSNVVSTAFATSSQTKTI